MPIANGPLRRITPGPNGLLRTSTPIPSETHQRGEHELAGELPARPQLEIVVERAEDRGQGRSPDQGEDLVGTDRARACRQVECLRGENDRQGHGQEDHRHRQAAAPGDRPSVDPAGLGRSTTPICWASRRTTGVSTSEPAVAMRKIATSAGRTSAASGVRRMAGSPRSGAPDRRARPHRRPVRSRLTPPAGREPGTGHRWRGPPRGAGPARRGHSAP